MIDERLWDKSGPPWNFPRIVDCHVLLTFFFAFFHLHVSLSLSLVLVSLSDQTDGNILLLVSLSDQTQTEGKESTPEPGDHRTRLRFPKAFAEIDH